MELYILFCFLCNLFEIIFQYLLETKRVFNLEFNLNELL